MPPSDDPLTMAVDRLDAHVREHAETEGIALAGLARGQAEMLGAITAGTTAQIRMATLAEERAKRDIEDRERADRDRDRAAKEASDAAQWWRQLVTGNAKWGLLLLLAIFAPTTIPYVLQYYGLAPPQQPVLVQTVDATPHLTPRPAGESER